MSSFLGKHAFSAPPCRAEDTLDIDLDVTQAAPDFVRTQHLRIHPSPFEHADLVMVSALAYGRGPGPRGLL